MAAALRAGATQWPRYIPDIARRKAECGDGPRTFDGLWHEPAVLHDGCSRCGLSRRIILERQIECCDGVPERDTAEPTPGTPDPYTHRPQCSRNHAAGQLAGLIGDLVGSLSVLRRLRPEPLSARVVRGEVADPYVRRFGETGYLQDNKERTREMRLYAVLAACALAEELRPRPLTVLMDIQDLDDEWGQP
jgi:hypothetical protein